MSLKLRLKLGKRDSHAGAPSPVAPPPVPPPDPAPSPPHYAPAAPHKKRKRPAERPGAAARAPLAPEHAAAAPAPKKIKLKLKCGPRTLWLAGSQPCCLLTQPLRLLAGLDPPVLTRVCKRYG